jgi:enoyl-CoA hydratase
LANALELVMLGDLIDAEEAHRIGLVNRIVPQGTVLEASIALATKLAALPAVAVQEAKAAVRGGVDLPLPTALDLEREHFLRTAASKDFQEGYRAFLERRPAVFIHA